MNKINPIIKDDVNEIINSFPHWSRFNNKTILISGANGLLPSYMVDVFLTISRKHELKIVCLVRNRKKAEIRFSHWEGHENLFLFEHDVNIPFLYSGKIDFIIHAASQASPRYYGIDPIGTFKANTIGTINLLDLAVEKNVEAFLFFSSGEVYGNLNEMDVPTKEDVYGYLDPIKVRSCYAESKRMGENMCISYFAQKNVKSKIVRPFHTYGPGLSLNDGRVYADFVKNCINNEDIVINGDGLAKRSFCYISDAILGFFYVLVNGKNGEVYNVGNPNEEYSIKELANSIAELFPEKKLNVIFNNEVQNNSEYLKSPISRNCPNINKIIQLGWIPKISIETGFRRTINSFLI